MWLKFGMEGCQLYVAQRTVLSVRQKAIQAPGNVAQMKSNRGELRWAAIHLIIGERTAPSLQIFVCKLESVQNRAVNRGNLCVRSS